MLTVTDCPMCDTPIPAVEMDSVRTCGSCGADLTRWRPKAVKPLEALVADDAAEPAGGPGMVSGVLGALGGAAIGVVLMLSFYKCFGFRFPLLGVGIGLLTGFGAKIFFKGTDNTLGVVSGLVALVAVVGSLFMMYGEFPFLSLISVVVSVSVAYRISSR